MALVNKHLYYKAGNNQIVIKCYSSLDDIYTNKGLPISYKNELFYAPLVPLGDVYASPFRVKDSGGEWAIAYDTVAKVQQHDFNDLAEIHLSGNHEEEIIYNTFPLVVPKEGDYHFTSMVRGGQTGWGYKGDSWQWSLWYLDLDGNEFKRNEYRRSKGMGWKTLYDENLHLTAGTHIIRLRIRGSCSSKDSHYTVCYEWKNTLTI